MRPGTGRSLDVFVDVFNVTNRANFENPTGDRRSTDFLNLTSPARGRRAHDRADRCAHAVLTPLVESRMRLMVP